MDRGITGRDGYLQEKAIGYAGDLARRLEDDGPYWRAYEVLGVEDFVTFSLGCAVAEIQARPDDPFKPWSDCQDMIAMVCNLVPRTLEREKLADAIERLTGFRPDFTDERAGEVRRFPRTDP